MIAHPELGLTLSLFPAWAFYILGFIGLFLVPGRLAVGMMGFPRFRFLLSVGLSYALLVVTLLVLQALNRPVSWFPRTLAAEISLLALGWALRAWRQHSHQPSRTVLSYRSRFRWHWRRWRIRRMFAVAWLGLMIGLVAYLTYAGPYLELPSDTLEHIRRSQLQTAMLDGDAFAAEAIAFAGNNAAVPIREGHWTLEQPLLKHVFTQAHHWYFLHAWLCRASGLPVARSALVLTLCTLATFLSGAYAFALFVFARLRASRWRKALASASAVVFLALHLGALVFAYVRYYALAPAMVNYVLFLAAMALAADFLTRPGWHFKSLITIGLITLTANAVHSQEALFIYFTCLALAAVAAWRAWLAPATDRKTASRHEVGTRPPAEGPFSGGPASPPAARSSSSSGGPGSRAERGDAPTGLTATPAAHPGAGINIPRQRRWKALVSLAVLGSIYGVLFASIRGLPQQPLDPRFVMPFQALLPFMRNLLIQPPWGQFYETVTIWGLVVYLVWVLGNSQVKKSLYVTAGMLLPLFTVFNPLTVDIITRANPMTQHQLWRVSYALPLHLVAGWFAIAWIVGLVRRHHPLALRLLNALALALLVALLFPWNTLYFTNTYSRVSTLARVPLGRDIRLYADLLEQAAGWNRARTRVITDALTAYVIAGTTGLDCQNSQFITAYHQDWLTQARTDEEFAAGLTSLDKDHDWLLVINERDGADSPTGGLSRHWPGDVLKVSGRYSPELKAFVDAHPDRFRRVWAQDRIAVYAIERE